MVYLKEVKWVGLRSTEEEAKAEVSGVRADQNGIRMEVRILNTVEHGYHVALTVCDKNCLLMIKERILVTAGYSPKEVFEEGKRRAAIFADAWLGLLVKN